MSDVYKKFTAQDYAVVPFNAHKQYNIFSSSFTDNKIKFFNASWTSESISLYSSESSVYGGDSINVIKYNQIDHLFYKNFKTDNSNRFGNFNYLKQKRELNEKTNIISIPTGLYGHEIKPGSFYLSSSNLEIIDDTHGNLIVSGTVINDHPTDIRSNLFKIGPIKGFKAQDLRPWDGYAVNLKEPHVYHGEKTKRFYRRGENNPNAPKFYTTPSGSEPDDSYFFNSLNYNKVSFTKSSSLLGNYHNNYSFINFNSLEGSYITSPHNEKFNFNKDNFAISFYIRPEGHTPVSSSNNPKTIDSGQNILKHGIEYGGGYIFHIESSSSAIGNEYNAYIVHPKIHSGYNDKTPTFPLTKGWGPGGTYLGGLEAGYIQSNSIIGGGEAMTALMANNEGTPGYLGKHITKNSFGTHNDWWLPNQAELDKIIDIFEVPLAVEMGTCAFPNLGTNPILGLTYPSPGGTPLTVTDVNVDVANAIFVTQSWGGSGSGTVGGTYRATTDTGSHHTFLQTATGTQIIKTSGPQQPFTCKPPIITLATSREGTDSLGNLFVKYILEFTGSGADVNNHTKLTKNLNLKQTQTNFNLPDDPNHIDNGFMLVRKQKIGQNVFDNLKRYIICKSTTKTVIPTAKNGNTKISENLQPIDTHAEPQFPFEIYMKSGSLHFDRSDGDRTVSVTASITSSNTNNPNFLSHILCQLSGSHTTQGSQHMEIYQDGILKSFVKDTTIKQTQNTANIYIGSKGKQSLSDSHNQIQPDKKASSRFYNGSLSHINIFNKAFNTASIKTISESINTSPYIGNIFYQQGLSTITHPKHYQIFSDNNTGGIGNMIIGQSFLVGENLPKNIKFQGSHLIYENEYQCTVEENEFNSTMNISARKIKSNNCNELADFATGSLFKPYITTIGLYDENNELLVVGKLGQPIRTSNETDTTFIMRWDT